MLAMCQYLILHSFILFFVLLIVKNVFQGISDEFVDIVDHPHIIDENQFVNNDAIGHPVEADSKQMILKTSWKLYYFSR